MCIRDVTRKINSKLSNTDHLPLPLGLRSVWGDFRLGKDRSTRPSRSGDANAPQGVANEKACPVKAAGFNEG